MKIFLINFNNLDNFCIFKHKNMLKIIIFSEKYYCKIQSDENVNDYFIDDFGKSLSFQSLDNFENALATKKFNFFFKSIFTSFFFKIRFNGKGFRLQSYKNKKIINFTFGYSHMYMLYLSDTRYKRISKYKYFFTLKSLKTVNFLKNIFKKVKPINKYTLRGLRISRTTIVKRKGRKSTNL